MKTSADWLEIQPGKRKYVHRWWPTQEPQANIGIVHGLGEHGGRYHSLARQFVSAGFSVTAFDQQGHGRSPESRGRVKSYDSLLDDIAAFLCWNQAQQPGIPTILFGHSMGGNLVINFALHNYPQPARLISSSPMIHQTSPLNPNFVRLARLLMRIAPNLKLRSNVIAERLMSDPEEQQLLREDELFHSQITLRLGASLLDSGRWALQNAAKIRTPLLLTHGTADYMTSPKASAEFARRAGASCELEILDGQLHDPFRGLEREVVIGRYVDFVRAAVLGQ